MRLTIAMVEMAETLRRADAPRRQLAGVADWQLTIASADTAAQTLGATDGRVIQDAPLLPLSGRWARPRRIRFLQGDVTHAAWRDLCTAITGALAVQIDTAEAAVAEARTKANVATGMEQFELAARWVERARIATAWLEAACTARLEGECLINREDRIMRPVGYAIASAGGITEVAKDKRYHQREGSRR